jgi:shikimate dehydrogenase
MTDYPSTRPLLAGVIGKPIYQSKSPSLHNFWLKKNNINGFYVPFEVEPKDLSKSIESLIGLGFRGVNITIPHKTSILTFADTVSDRASIIGAANTLFFNNSGQINADNTDSYGFTQNLYQSCPSWKPKIGPALIYGAGGAARAVCYALLSEGVPKVRILNRTKVKAQVIAENFGARVEVIDWYSSDDVLEDSFTIVNTTSLGMIGQPELQPNFSCVPKTALVTDLVYNPLSTPFLRSANKYNLNCVDGIGMLIHQAVPGFIQWFGKKPIVDNLVRENMLSL